MPKAVTSVHSSTCLMVSFLPVYPCVAVEGCLFLVAILIVVIDVVIVGGCFLFIGKAWVYYYPLVSCINIVSIFSISSHIIICHLKKVV